MAGMKSLAKDTAVYGLSSIIGKFLNWCLVPLYVNVFAAGEYGSVTYLYSLMALLLVILTYGMETGFFRFANHRDYDDPQTIYTTSLISVATTSSLFFFLTLIFLTPISGWLGYPEHTDYIWMLALIIALDAFSALPFAYLRYKRRPVRFASIKLLSIFLNIALNLFLILFCPYLYRTAPELVDWFYTPSYGIGYIFVANLISSAVVVVALTPEIFGIRYRFDGKALKRILRYSFPLLILGVAGIMNQTLDKILYPELRPDRVLAMKELGIYGANYKIAIVMVMFIQAFRFAYEPFIFAKSGGEDNKKGYSDAMKYFIIFGLFIFLGVMFYLDILRYFINPSYFSGLKVVPVVMLAEFFFGIFFNLSLWYKLTDRTRWGAWFSLFGCAITVAINVAFVPRFGYMACAWAAFVCYFSMMVVSYVIGQRIYPIRYDVRSAVRYLLLSGVLYGIASVVAIDNTALRLAFRTCLLFIFIGYVIKNDLPVREIPLVNRWIKR